MPDTQGDQFISVTTPLGDDVLLLQKFTGQEAISQLFKFQLELASEKSPPLIEQPTRYSEHGAGDGSTRYLNGFVSQFGQTGRNSRSLLSRRDSALALVPESDIGLSNFSEQNRTGNHHQIFQEFGFRDFRNALQGTYEPRLMSRCNTARATSILFRD